MDRDGDATLMAEAVMGMGVTATWEVWVRKHRRSHEASQSAGHEAASCLQPQPGTSLVTVGLDSFASPGKATGRRAHVAALRPARRPASLLLNHTWDNG